MRTTMYNLLVYPHTFDKLFKELKDANVSRPYPTWTEIRNLPYLDACVLEGIRMHPPFALPFERVVPKGGMTIAGQHIPEGTNIGGNAYVVNRHKGWFGDDAEFWRPERWLEKDEAHKRKLEAGILTVSTFHDIHVFDSSNAFFRFHSLSLRGALADCAAKVRRWEAHLHRQVCGHSGNQEDLGISHSQL